METEVDPLDRLVNWTPEAKARAMEAANAQTDGTRKVWYCASPGPTCDGQPHPGYDYPHARADQWPPLDAAWFIWLLSGGRGSGKTRSGAEYVRKATKQVSRIALVAPTSADVRDTMIEGESGLEVVCAAAGEPIKWEPSKRKITFSNGCIGKTFSGEEPDRLRGPQAGLAWLDEPAHIPLIEDVWDNLLFGLRLGQRPRVVLTTTPRPTKWLRARIAEVATRTIRVSTRANLDNLAPTFAENIMKKYEGTRLGRQELDGELLEDVEGALWNADIIRRSPIIDWTLMERIIVSIDPAGTANSRSDETGIVVVGKIGDSAYVIDDKSGKYSPDGWASQAITLYEKYEADAIIAEKNYGGEMVEANIRNALKSRQMTARILITTSTRSKSLRAEPVVGLYEQKRAWHIGSFTNLEDEMLTWVPNESKSPNRIDALVFAVTELIKLTEPPKVASARGRSVGSATRAGGYSQTRLAIPGRSRVPVLNLRTREYE
jgi:phage terminase large subunit-like protein